MSGKQDVQKFYDDYVDKQQIVGINERHYSIVNYLLEFGLKPDSKVLEIGCGIGTLTELLSGVIPNGQLLANDISPKSIDIASEKLKKYTNVDFIVGDIAQQNIEGKFDVIVMPDVLEHIPPADHFKIFAKLSELIDPKGFILIHIPNPNFLEWCHVYNNKGLQVIDEPVHTNHLVEALYPNNLYLHYLKTYSIWFDNHDYQVIVAKKKLPLEEQVYNHMEKEITFIDKVKHKLSAIFRN